MPVVDTLPNIHFAGIGGVGMSALAQIHVMAGGRATGSDRIFDRGGNQRLKDKLQSMGIKLFPQDGSGVGGDTGLVVLSTAIEDANPEVAAAKSRRVAMMHRSELLARHVRELRTIAVTGTSGKSTVVAMVFEILEAAGRSPSVITGGSLVALEERGLFGNAYRGTSSLLVIEADESDGSLVNYHPALGLFLNLTKDHKEVPVMKEIFRKFRGNVQSAVLNADDPNLADLAPARTFGVEAGEVRARELELSALTSRFRIQGQEFSLPIPGRHNVENAAAAVAACVGEGVSLSDCSRALAGYKGVARRFQILGQARGVTVVDDYAHNPAKVAAALAAAHLRAGRVLAVYQPHGFAPTKLLKNELIEAFASGLRPDDRLWIPDIYYVGGTTSKDISSRDVAAPLAGRGVKAAYVPQRADIIAQVRDQARDGDMVLIMGARDPSLPDFARDIFRALSA